jgi:SRSO17 transposase
MVGTTSDWRAELGRWLKPFLDRLGHKARRQMCPLYVSGLIGPGDRKSVQPMAARVALGKYDQLHHFIASGVWDAWPVETELLVQADRLVGGSDAVLVIDDTAIAKKGTHSVGVAAQYASALGKTANCQTLVSLTLARGEVPVMLALRLFLPESGTSDRARLKRAGVPAEYLTARTKPELALVEIERAIAAGVRFGCVLADAGYGMSAPFRQALTARKLTWAVGIPRHLKVYPADVKMIWPVAKARSSPKASRPRCSVDTGGRHASPCQMAHHQLAHRYKGKAQGSLCCCSRAGRRWAAAADWRQGSAASARRGGLAHRRT